MSNPQTSKSIYRSADEDEGGLFDFYQPSTVASNSGPDTSPATWSPHLIHHIGTARLRTCVGVYFAIDANRCFVAHINALVRCGPKSPDITRLPAGDQGPGIRDMVLDRLQKHATEHGWMDTVARITKEEKWYVTCPELFDGDNSEEVPSSDGNKGEMRLVGWYVVQGVKEFLGLSVDDEHVLDGVERVAGFVVNHTGQGPPDVVAKQYVRDLEDVGMFCSRREGGEHVTNWKIVKVDEA